MDYEKKYKHALECAKEIISYYKEHNRGDEASIEDLEGIFPELAESEDERIRKEIIDFLWKEKIYLQEVHSSVENNPKYRFVMDAIDWLEKQGEQKVSEYDIVKTIKGRIIEHFENHLIIDKCFSIGGLKDDILKIINKVEFEKQGEKISVVDFKAEDWYVSKVDGKIYNAKYMEQNSCKKTTRREEIEKAAFSTTGIIEQTDWFIKGAEWADKHPDINFVFLTGFEASQEDIVSKLQSLIKEWKLHDSSEAKYRLEAYKELLESIKQ